MAKPPRVVPSYVSRAERIDAEIIGKFAAAYALTDQQAKRLSVIAELYVLQAAAIGDGLKLVHASPLFADLQKHLSAASKIVSTLDRELGLPLVFMPEEEAALRKLKALAASVTHAAEGAEASAEPDTVLSQLYQRLIVLWKENEPRATAYAYERADGEWNVSPLVSFVVDFCAALPPKSQPRLTAKEHSDRVGRLLRSTTRKARE